MNQKILIQNKVNVTQFWPSLGKNYETFAQMACELLDNALSNFRWARLPRERCKVMISLREEDEGIYVRVEDGGTGIRDLDNALTLAGCADQETELNEHGLGLKNVLSAGDSENRNWKLSTRNSKTAKDDCYLLVKAPYDICGSFSAEVVPGWVGTIADTGTVIEFTCKRELVETIVPGKESKTLESCCCVLQEILGVTYFNALDAGELTVVIQILRPKSSEVKKVFTVMPIQPDWDPEPKLKYGMTWDNKLEWKTAVEDFGGGAVDIRYQSGFIHPQPENWKYYRGNMESSGVEIVINGRLIASNLFKECFSVRRHNVYNRYLARIELSPHVKEGDGGVQKDCLPPTNPTKTGFVPGDPRTKKLYNWIGSCVKIPALDTAGREKALLDWLEKKERNTDPKPVRVEREYLLFDDMGDGVPADLVVFRRKQEGEMHISLYEAKARDSRPLDVFQMVMYWYGLVHKGERPTIAYLVADDHSPTVRRLAKYLNVVMDTIGECYHFELKTWEELGAYAAEEAAG